MKKVFVLSIVFMLIVGLVLTGCQSTPAPAPAPTTPAPAPTTPAAPASPITSDETVELTFAFHAPPTASLTTAIFEPWATEVEEASNGRIKITRYPGETLVKAGDAYDAVATGLCDIAQVDTEMNPGRFPVLGINTLPFFYPSTEVAGIVSHEILNKYAVDSELQEVKLLITAPLHFAQYFGNKPVEKLEDFAGLKIRASGKVEASAIDALGAIPVEVGTGDMFSALDRGTIDGCFFAYSGALAFGIKDATKYRTELEFLPRVFLVAMNKDAYNQLPADLKEIIDQYSTPETSYQFAKAHQAAQAGPKNAIIGSDKGAGNPPIYVLPDEEKERWMQVTKVTWDEWVADVTAKGINGQEIMDEAISLVNQYSQ